MAAYILRRLLLMVPTIFGIMAISFAIVQFAPGGPVERVIAQLQGHDVGATSRFTGAQDGSTLGTNASAQAAVNSKYRGAQGLDPEFIAELEAQFGFDKPVHERFFKMVGDYARFDFGESYYRDIPVVDLIMEKLDLHHFGALDDAFDLSDFHSIGHCQSAARRHAFRCLDLGGDYCRLCHSGLFICRHVDCVVCRRLLSRLVSLARSDLG